MGKLKEINAGVGKRIKRVRTDKRLSQEAFGERIGVSKGFVYQLERGARMPSQGLVIAISAVFVVVADCLRTGRNR